MSNLWTTRTTCRACDGPLTTVLDLGLVALNAFPKPDDPPVEKAPLEVCLCDTCHLCQLRHTVSRPRLFSRYWYRSSTQPAMVADLGEAVAWACERVTLEKGDRVLIVGINDGTEARFIPEHVKVVGIDPAANLRASAALVCDTFVNDYFPSPLLPKGPYKVVLSLACLYSMENLKEAVAAIHDLLADDGVWVAQVSDAFVTFADNNIGDLTFEHVSFFTLGTLGELVQAHGLYIEDYQRNAVNGGSIRIAVRKGNLNRIVGSGIRRYHIEKFGTTVHLCGDALKNRLMLYRSDGLTVGGYGAATKANTMLSFWDIGPDLLPWIADRNPEKWGRRMVTGIDIISEEEARARNPDILVLMIPQFLDAVMEREAAFLDRGGRFVIPFPEVREVFRPRVKDRLEATG